MRIPESNDDTLFMKEALSLAAEAGREGETPIGAVITYEGRIIAKGRNRRNTSKNPLCHAEIEAIGEASRVLGDWRLENCTLYVTLEPCPMCAGAILQSRMERVVIGAMSPKAGCAGSVVDLLRFTGFNHVVKTESGVMAAESKKILQGFFETLRSQDPGIQEENRDPLE